MQGNATGFNVREEYHVTALAPCQLHGPFFVLDSAVSTTALKARTAIEASA